MRNPNSVGKYFAPAIQSTLAKEKITQRFAINVEDGKQIYLKLLILVHLASKVGSLNF